MSADTSPERVAGLLLGQRCTSSPAPARNCLQAWPDDGSRWCSPCWERAGAASTIEALAAERDALVKAVRSAVAELNTQPSISWNSVTRRISRDLRAALNETGDDR